MCGISGVVEAEGAPDRSQLERMGQAIAHRGPDDGRIDIFGKAGFSFRRLSIIDVAGGRQPISNETGRIHVMCNGEIYNYLDLRRELESLGHRFKTHSDVETIVHGYEEWGDDIPKRLHGMFAFAIWDEERQRLLLGRDRLGKKPLIYAAAQGRITFGSEFSAVLADRRVPRDVDRKAIHDYLTYQYVPPPASGFLAVSKLPPAHILVFEGGVARTARYWQPSCRPRLNVSLEDAVAETATRFKEAVRKRLMSEVPLGAFLSGGVDSSLTVAFMSEFTRVKTFSIGFEEGRFNELPHARAVAERYGTDHHEFVVKPQAADVLPKLVRHYGEPYADSSALPTYYLSKLTREHVTVALNGDGGDEFFGGYDRYRTLPYFRLARRLGPLAPAVHALARVGALPPRVRRLLGGVGREPREAYGRLMSYFFPEQKAALYSDAMRAEMKGRDSFQWMFGFMDESGEEEGVRLLQYSDAMTYLPGDILTKVDIATMANSLEGRSPLLDHELVEWALRLPEETAANASEGKLVLKALARRHLPLSVIDRPKQGFGIPIDSWFRGELEPMARDLLLSKTARERDLFRPEAVESLISEHTSGRDRHGFRLWTLLCLELWFREVVEAAA
jgi:asparagine synthase (glutamine-hydrolysing)